MPSKGASRIQRQSRLARLLHGVNAVTLLILVATGLALGDRLATPIVAAMGGHMTVNSLHRLLGLVFAVAAVLAIAAFHSQARSLVRDLAHFRLRELSWPVTFLRQLLSPSKHPEVFHAGRFDPVERAVLMLLLCATAVVSISGVYLYFLPDAPRWVMLFAIRTHIYGAWTIIGASGLHLLAGSGILPSHRGIFRTMFGDGTLPVATAERLWPDWTRKNLEHGHKSD